MWNGKWSNICNRGLTHDLIFMNFSHIFFVMLLVASISFQSQGQDQQRIDSLSASLNGKIGNDRINTLYELSATLLDDDNQLSLRFSRQAFYLATRSGETMQIVRTGRVMGSGLWRLQKLDSSRHVYR